MSALRSSIEGANRILGWLKSGKKISWSSSRDNLRLNLGCGLAVAEGWLNIDGSLNALVATMPRFVHRLAYRLTGARSYYSEKEYCQLLRDNEFLHHDLTSGIPLPDRTAAYIFSSHFLEHLSEADGARLLRECLRVLKPGGVLRLSVPDLEYAVSLYFSGQKQKMLRNYFFVDDDDSYFARHKYMYDFSMLSENLLSIGFTAVNRRQYRAGETPDLHVLDNRPEESLFIEAVK